MRNLKYIVVEYIQILKNSFHDVFQMCALFWLL